MSANNLNKAKAAEAALSELLASDWSWQLKDNPEFASQAGVHEHDARLQDLSPEAFEARVVHGEEVLTRASALAVESLGEPSALHLSLFVKSVRDEVDALRLGCHLMPVNSIGYGGVANNFVEALDWLPEGVDGDGDFVQRLAAFPAQVEQYCALLRCGVARGVVATRAMLRAVPKQLAALVDDFDEGRGGVASRVQRCAATPLVAPAAAAASRYRDAIETLGRFFVEEYAPHARESPGCTSLPDGKGVAFYARCIAFHTTTSMGAEEIHAIGLAEVKRIEGRFRADVMAPLGFSEDVPFAAFVAKCKSPEGAGGIGATFFATPNALIASYRTLVERIRVETLPSFFETFPAAPLEVVAKTSATAPAAYYMCGTADGSRPGRFYVNVSNLEGRPSYEMTALALHEGMPGHHHQGMLAIENAAIPPFLRFIEDRRYEFCPARRQLYAAYLEGWALYCESLGEEMTMVPDGDDDARMTGGIYDTPLKLFGRLSMEMMRAVRLVVDTGIHSEGWSVTRAIDYFESKTGMHRHEAEAECYRYEAWPGQALAYKVGEVAIWRMRRKAETALGPAFDLKAFHTVILDGGPMPLDSLAEKVEAWTLVCGGGKD